MFSMSRALRSRSHFYANMDLLSLTEEGYLNPEPEEMLDQRVVKHHNRAIIELLIKWKNMSRENASYLRSLV